MVGPKGVALTTVFVVAGIFVTLVLIDGTVMGTLLGSVTLPNTGTVKAMGVGVYWDSSCSNQVTTINWGTVNPGSTKDVTVYIKNEGNAPETLSLEIQNWNPTSASSYMSLTWDYEGEYLKPGPLSMIRIVGQEGFETIQAYPVELDMYLPNRRSGWNFGGTGDPPWGEFFKDDAIQAVNVRLLKTDDTEITEEYFSLLGYHADDYRLTIEDADREANDPLDVEIAADGVLTGDTREHHIRLAT